MARRDRAAELAQVQAAIAAAESLRGSLPVDRFETILAPLKAQENELLAAQSRRSAKSSSPSGRAGASRQRARVRGDGAVAQGKAVAAGAKGAAIGGDVHGDVVVGGATADRETRPTPASLERAYLTHLLEEVSCVSLAGIDPKVATSDPQERLQLEAVYTALMTVSGGDDVRSKRVARELKLRQRSALERLDASDRLVLLGDPGSGKSTFVGFVALCLAGDLLGSKQVNRSLLTAPLPGQNKPQPWRHRNLLPVRVVLRDFAAEGLPPVGTPTTGADLWRFLERGLERAGLTDYAPLLRKRLLERGGLLLLDGLDEVPEAEQRRLQIRQAIEDFVATHARCRVLATSRTYAYQNQGWRLNGFEEAILAPFGWEQVGLFVERWYAHLAAVGRLKREDAAGRAEVLRSAILASDRLQGLAERPLLLTLMASLHSWRGGNLPERREELYADAVNLLLDLWERQRLRRAASGALVAAQPSLAEWLRTDREAVRRVLEDLAFEAHAGQPAAEGGGAVAATADIPEGALVARLMALAKSEDANPKRLIEYLSERAGLLIARGVGVYTLPHRTFQEYLAACRLTRETFPDEVCALARQDPNRWREVLLLAAAKAARGAVSTVWALAEVLCSGPPGDDPTPDDAWGAHLAGQALVESAQVGSPAPHHRRRVELLRAWHLRLLVDERLPPVERALAGDTLAALGDPRFDAQHWWLPAEPLLGFLEVPAGRFRMGEGEGGGGDAHELELPRFWVARWPVTVAQFGRFLADAGQPMKELGSAVAAPSSRPVTRVSQLEATAYVDWLHDRLVTLARERVAGDEHPLWAGLADGTLRVSLPSEAEWEKAARGEDGRAYPWGDDHAPSRANDGTAGIGRPSAVGCFPRGASPYGAEELVGNVLEWTRSAPADYPYRPRDGRERRDEAAPAVLRGGAFFDAPVFLRCAVRNGFGRDVRNDLIGFRVVVSPFPSGR